MLKPIAIALASTGLAAALFGVGVQHNQVKDRLEKIYDRTVSLNGASGLVAHVPIGCVTVTAGSGSQIVVHVIRWVKGGNTDFQNRWLDESRTEVGQSGNDVTITDRFKDGESDNERRDNNLSSFGVEYEIHVPKGLRLNVGVSAGKAKLSGEFSAVSAKVEAGSIKADIPANSQAGGKYSVQAGSIDLALDPALQAVVKADVSVGKIEGLAGPKDRRSDDGIQLGDHRKVTLGSGGALITASVQAGSIKVEGGSSVTKSEVDEPTVEALKSKDSDAEILPPDFDKKIRAEVDKALEQADTELQRITLPNIHVGISSKVDKEVQKAMAARDKAMMLEDKELSKLDQKLSGQDLEMDADVETDLDKAVAERDTALKLKDKALSKLEHQLADRDWDINVDVETAVQEALKSASLALEEAGKEMAAGKEDMKRAEIDRSVTKDVAKALARSAEAMRRARERMKALSHRNEGPKDQR